MTIRVGIIGAGAIADDHCHHVSSYEGAEAVAIADLSAAPRKELKKTWGMSRAYCTWEELIADPEIDAVTIALPNALHAPCTLAAIAAGKHVMLDKPFAINYAEAKRCATAARRKRRVLMVGMNQRYNDEAQKLRALIERGDLGDIYHTKAYWYRRAGSPKFGTWFVNKQMSGGGCLLDIGVHILDLGMYLSGSWRPVAVSGQTYSMFGHRGIGEGGWGKSTRDKKIKFDVDDFATALIKCHNGATLELNVSWVLHQEQADRHNVELYGTEAGASLFPTKIFRFGKKKGEYEVVEPQQVKVPDLRTCRQHDWLDAISRKRESICTLEQALVVQQILDGIYTSSETGREVRIK
jgi:predicted dehydrogenase